MKKNWDPKRRVVVTGLGVVSSIGIGWQEFWKNLLAGKSGISQVEYVDTSDYDRHIGGEIKGFEIEKYIKKPRLKKLGKASQFGIFAAKLAFEDAGIDVKSVPDLNLGLFVGTTMGEAQKIEKIVSTMVNQSKKDIQALDAMLYPANNISVNIAKYFKIGHNNMIFANACAAGNYALGRALDSIRSGRRSIALAGGVDALSRIAYTGFSRLYAMAPEKCQPFDKNRKGMVVGEGAGFLILESLENAKKRGARVYAEILNYSLSCDAKHMTNPSRQGIVQAMQKSLGRSYVKPEQIDYISAHGTGTIENDKAESDAINAVFDGRAQTIPVSSIKSMIGHTMGAASALESIACCLALKDGKIPPTINFKEKDSDCDVDCVANKSREKKIITVLNNSQAFGGNNACVILRSSNAQK